MLSIARLSDQGWLRQCHYSHVLDAGKTTSFLWRFAKLSLMGRPSRHGTVPSPSMFSPARNAKLRVKTFSPPFRPISPRNSSRHLQKTSTSA